MFTTKGILPNVNTNENKNNYIQPGIVIASIANIDIHQAATGNEGLRINFIAEDGSTAEHVYYITSNEVTRKVMLDKIVDIATALGVKEAVDNISSTTLKDYAMDLSDILSNKPARWKFTGEEVNGKNGNWWKAKLGFYNFVESLSVEPTKLTFDPSNTRDMKHLEVAPTADSVIEGGTSSGQDW